MSEPKVSFRVIREYAELEHEQLMVSLIQKQLISYGVKKTQEEVLSGLKNALKPGARSVLFCCFSPNDTLLAFAFGNVGSGLESGSDYLWLNELYVDEDSRRQHIGTNLLTFVEHWAKPNSITYVALITGSQNMEAQHLYKKLGYSIETVPWIDKQIL